MWRDDDDLDGLRRMDGLAPLHAAGAWSQALAGAQQWFLGALRGARGAELAPVPAEPERTATQPPPVPARSLEPAAPLRLGQPATLRQLGLPGELAHELEVAFRAMGATEAGRVVRFRFRAEDETCHEVVLEPIDRAA
jgi:hypothetical protein